MSRPLRTLGLLLGVLLSWACEKPAATPEAKPAAPAVNPRHYFGKPPDGLLHVYFFDVDQGDSALIVSPTGSTVLIDAGPSSAGMFLATRLPELLTQKLDLVILTHPHADHYGGLAAAVAAVGARKLLEPQLPNTPSDYDALLASLAADGVAFFSPAPPNGQLLRLPLGGDTELTVLWPRAPAEPLLPDTSQERNSIVVRLTYRNTSVLFMGDAYEQTERKLLEGKAPLNSTLLKVGAHGSFLATSAAFLKAVSPEAAIISTGASAPERAPPRDVLGRLEAQKVHVYRTDYDGEVDGLSDGLRFILTPQRSRSDAQVTSEVFEGHAPPPPPAAQDAGTDVTPPPTTPEAPATKAPAAGSPKAVESAVARPVDTATKVVEAKGRGGASDINLDNGTPSTPKGGHGKSPAEPTAGHYVGNRHTRVFHTSSCASVRRMNPENIVPLNSKSEAVAQGFKPAGDCKP